MARFIPTKIVNMQNVYLSNRPQVSMVYRPSDKPREKFVEHEKKL